MKDDCVAKEPDMFYQGVIVIVVCTLMIAGMGIYFSQCSKDDSWKRCRDHHSKQVCINLLQETGDETKPNNTAD